MCEDGQDQQRICFCISWALRFQQADEYQLASSSTKFVDVFANYDYDFATIQFNYTLPAAMHFMQKFARQAYLRAHSTHMPFEVGWFERNRCEFRFCHTIVEANLPDHLHVCDIFE